MTPNPYQNLGISSEDISQIKKYNLTHILDKIRVQQDQIISHEEQIQQALDKINRDLAAARDAQMSLLPRELTGVPQIEFKARFFPSQFVSGDIYNVFRLDEAHIGVYHIDISGHGVPAALFSVSLSQMLNTTISKKNLLKVPVTTPPFYRINPPDKVVGILNEDKSFELNDVYFTMVYMILNIQENFIQYCRAGHNPPIILKPDGQIVMSEKGGFPIGWDFPREDPIIRFDLEAGDRIYMYSDGITEAADSSGKMFSKEKMIDYLKQNREKSLDNSLDAVIQAVQDFSGSEHFEDDVSIVGLEWK